MERDEVGEVLQTHADGVRIVSTYTYPIPVAYWITGIAASIGARAYDAAGIALAVRQTSVATEEGATGLYTVRVTLDDTWTLPLTVKVDDGAGTIHIETIVVDASGGGGVGAGTGDIAVNHNTGGTDHLAFKTSGGDGIDGATVRAYVKSEYDAGTRTVRGQVMTGTDGRWIEDMMLDADTYTFVFTAPGYQTASIEQAVA